jgi:hypothetical protein
MASTTQKWFIGCGIGCGLMILITAIIGGGVFFAVKDVMKDGKSIEESNDAMIEAFGMPDDFTPSPSGAISSDRMEIFLAARDMTSDSRDKMAEILNTLDDDSDEGEGGPLAKIKAGLSLVPAVLSFLNDRNNTLLEYGMGDGEYTYIYALAYFSYLDKDLTDGPSFQMTGDDGDDDGGVSWKVESSSGGVKVRDKREKRIRRHMHELQMSFLMNQIAGLDAAAGVDEGLAAALEEERTAMNSAWRRMLWEEGLPPAIEASIAPYADQLNESYVPIMNVIEMGLANTN